MRDLTGDDGSRQPRAATEEWSRDGATARWWPFLVIVLVMVAVWVVARVDVLFAAVALMLTLEPGPRRPRAPAALLRNGAVALVVVAISALIATQVRIGLDAQGRMVQGVGGVLAGLAVGAVLIGVDRRRTPRQTLEGRRPS